MGTNAKYAMLGLMILLVMLFALVEREMAQRVAEKKEKTKKVEWEPHNPFMDIKPADKVELNYYTVQRGDTFPKISRKCYGDSREWRKIFEANKDLVSSPTRLRVGQRLYIPPQKPLDMIGK